MDMLGNINAREGIDRCQCGCKYWENDKCVDCDTLVEVVRLRQDANVSRYMNEVKLNVMLTTMEHNLGFDQSVHTLDLVTTTEKYRQMGVIQ